ncbi:MAG: cytochrome c [Alphaproteobacteria bacterium]|nr:cytochrome c [Alphaproteobacteria bacterium]
MLLLIAVGIAGQPTKRPTDEERGEELYRRHCAACHGAANDGQGPISAALVAPVPALAGQVKADDPTAVLVLKGRGAMPAYEATFDKLDAIRVLKFMMALSAEAPMSATPGKPATPARPDPTKQGEEDNAEPDGAQAGKPEGAE